MYNVPLTPRDALSLLSFFWRSLSFSFRSFMARPEDPRTDGSIMLKKNMKTTGVKGQINGRRRYMHTNKKNLNKTYQQYYLISSSLSGCLSSFLLFRLSVPPLLLFMSSSEFSSSESEFKETTFFLRLAELTEILTSSSSLSVGASCISPFTSGSLWTFSWSPQWDEIKGVSPSESELDAFSTRLLQSEVCLVLTPISSELAEECLSSSSSLPLALLVLLLL